MKEPVYECENCGRDLKSFQIGQVKWCTSCQIAWDVGFNSGMRAHKQIIDKGYDEMKDYIEAMKAFEPFEVRE